MKVLHGITKQIFFGFFASHIIFTLIVDGQAVFPSYIYPTLLHDFLSFYISTFNDPLMKYLPIWFQSMIVMEYCIQLPYFFIACYYISSTTTTTKDNNTTTATTINHHYPQWFQKACITYGAHTATTMIPILTCLITNDETSNIEKCRIVAVYLPYLIFPLWIWYLAILPDDSSNNTNKIKRI